MSGLKAWKCEIGNVNPPGLHGHTKEGEEGSRGQYISILWDLDWLLLNVAFQDVRNCFLSVIHRIIIDGCELHVLAIGINKRPHGS